MIESNHLRVPDGAIRGNASRLHGVDNLLRENGVADDDDGFGVELLVGSVRETDDIGAPVEGVVDDGVGIGATDSSVDGFAEGFLG